MLTSSVLLAWICGCGTRLQRTIQNSLPLLFSQHSIYEAFPRAWGHLGCFRILVSSLSDNFRLLKSVCVPSVTWCHKQLVLPWQLYRIKVLLSVKLWVMWPSSVAGEDRHKISTYFATKTNPDSHKRKTNPELEVPCELITRLAILIKPSFFDFVISACSTRCETLRSVPSFPQSFCDPGRCIFSKESAVWEERDKAAQQKGMWPLTYSPCSSWCHMLCWVQLLPHICCVI